MIINSSVLRKQSLSNKLDKDYLLSISNNPKKETPCLSRIVMNKINFK